MWPPQVERFAALLRGAGVEGRLEELGREESAPPGLWIRAEAYDCDRRVVVALVPDDRELDLDKLRATARCPGLRAIDPPAFPYGGATVLIDRLVLGERAVWIEAGSPRHVASIAPVQLVDLTRATAVELVADA